MSQPNQDIKQDDVILQLRTEVQQFVHHTIVINTAEQFTDAGEKLKRVKSALKQIEDKRTEYTAPLNKTVKAINEDAKAASAPWLAAESGIKRAMIEYQNEQDRIRQEEQRKADEAARKERERIEAQAKRAAEAGKTDKAEALEERAATVVAPVIQREAPKVAGINMRDVWKFEITDPNAVPREYLVIDESKIRKVVGALKADANIPGVRVYSEKQMAAGAA